MGTDFQKYLTILVMDTDTEESKIMGKTGPKIQHTHEKTKNVFK